MLTDLVAGFGKLVVYYGLCVIGALALRRFVRVPAEVFRKTLHLILLGSLFVFLYGFGTWTASALAAVLFVAAVYPALAAAERLPGYSQLLTERKAGEIKRSLVVVFAMYATLAAVGWGWLGERYLVTASVMAWGLGDAAAALVGKRFGSHFIEGRLVEGRKSVEGTLAMFLVSFLSVLAVLLVHSAGNWRVSAAIAAVTAAVSAAVELCTRDGMDTITCPFAAAAVLIPLVRALGV